MEFGIAVGRDQFPIALLRQDQDIGLQEINGGL